MKIAITTSTFGKYDISSFFRLKENNIEFILNPFGRKLSEQEVVKLSTDVEGIIAGTESLSRQVLSVLPKLKVISRCGVGMDNIDMEAADSLGIKVFKTSYGPTLAVAELTVALILNLLKKIVPMDRDLKSGSWHKRMGNLLYKKNIGIIGFGRIGQKVAELLQSFDVQICYYDIMEIQSSMNCRFKSLNEILAWAEIVSLHLSYHSDKKFFLGKDELRQMKKGAWLLNLARGGMVDESELFNSLKKGLLSGAALDVFEKEPYDGPLGILDNIILTPHIGSYAIEARTEMEKQAVDNLLEGLTQ